jgi:RNA polymerase sigma-70 factor, ECF subfamily
VAADHDSFADFLADLRANDGTAARQLFDRFSRRLIGLARRRFDGPFRHKVDPEDVVQSAYKSFFHRYGDGDFEAVNWDSLWGLLTIITLRKCAERVAYHRAQRRDVNREAGAPAGADAPSPWEDALTREPTPDEAAELAETLGRLMLTLDPAERPVLELSLQGFTTQEISDQLDRPERTVRRLRERIRARLEAAQGGGL